jgi:N-acetylglutamate synthase-like GNAT family acetyltransferase
MIVEASILDAKQLTEIALKSKAFWGYSDELVESWRKELTVTKKILQECFVKKFLVDDKIVGFYILNPPKNNLIELEMLFVLPQFIGNGIGKQLLYDSFKQAKLKEAKKTTLLADPNAVPFYKKHGFIMVDKKESSIPGRFSPVMKKDVEV